MGGGAEMTASLPRRLFCLLFPPRCRVCGKRVGAVFSDRACPLLCDACLSAWRAWQIKPCPVCKVPTSRCRCVPPLLHESGCDTLVSLVPYVSSGRSVPARLILRVKEHADRPLFRFFADSLALPVWQELIRLGAAAGNGGNGRPGDAPNRVPDSTIGGTPDDFRDRVVVTFVPRRPAAVRLTGLDQAALIARALAGALELPWARLLHHSGRHSMKTAQKYLSADERVASARRAYSLRRGETDLSGKTVVLVDDICTTGASLAACARLLLLHGAENVLAVTVGRTRDE